MAAWCMVMLGLGMLVARAMEHFPKRDGGQVSWAGVGLASALCCVMAALIARRSD